MIDVHGAEGRLQHLLLREQRFVPLDTCLEVRKEQLLQLLLAVLTLLLHGLHTIAEVSQNALCIFRLLGRLRFLLLNWSINLLRDSFLNGEERQWSLLILFEHIKLSSLAVICLLHGSLHKVLRSRDLLLDLLQLLVPQRVALLELLRMVEKIFVGLLQQHDLLRDLRILLHHFHVLLLLLLQLSVEDNLLMLQSSRVFLLHESHLLLQLRCTIADACQCLRRFIHHF
mmetsp:Transcript_48825/g.87925  ORF Transcript_48825/g.87925 Transcript_48825/m.87925 type:complete len:228 (+) Transcript_48825:204-887(+)